MRRVKILELDNLSIGYETESGYVRAARGVSLDIGRRESFGLVGESGSGKSTLALAAIRYLAANGRVDGGRISFLGEDITAYGPGQMSRLWGRQIGMVYQNPSLALNPSLRIGWQLAEAVRVHKGLGRKAAWTEAVATMASLSMPDPGQVTNLYPHQLSGGMLQRCVISMALMNNPDLLVMDEPTTALDVTTQAVVLDLVAGLKRKYDSAIFYITHDLAVVAKICDNIGVMYAGELLESGPTRDLFKKPRHPYTLSLIGSIPKFEAGQRKRALAGIDGLIPSLRELPQGCVFSPRCFMADDDCRQKKTVLSEISPGRRSACLKWAEVEERHKDLGPPKFYPPPAEADPRLATSSLVKIYRVGGGFRKRHLVRALNSVSLSVPRGYTLGIVGESGCGKTTLLRAITGLVETDGGQVLLENTVLPPNVRQRDRGLLKKIQLVFQNPADSLNPNQTVARSLERPLKIFTKLDKRERRAAVLKILASVNLPDNYYHRLPGELSGGELQRIGIARAFSAEPEVILLDEPLSALDVSVQAALVNLLFELQARNQPSYIFISHDLAAVHHISDWIAVIYLGRVVEFGPATEIFRPPFHPYTEALLSAIPDPDPDAVSGSLRLEGTVPSPSAELKGCPFHSRCPRRAGPDCAEKEPPLRQSGDARIYCHLPLKKLAALQTSHYHAAGKASPESRPC